MGNKDRVIGRDVLANKRPSSGVYYYEGMQYKGMRCKLVTPLYRCFDWYGLLPMFSLR